MAKHTEDPILLWYLALFFQLRNHQLPALDMLERVVDMGYTDANIDIANYYDDNDNPELARQAYRQGTEAGSVNCAYEYGIWCYERENYGDMKWALEFGVQQGHIPSIIFLQYYYLPIDKDTAVEYAELATQYGHTPSMWWLGKYYEDLNESSIAIHYYVMGSEADDIECCKALAIWADMRGHIDDVIYFHRRAADLGDLDSLCHLWEHYVISHSNKAIMYMQEAEARLSPERYLRELALHVEQMQMDIDSKCRNMKNIEKATN